MSFRLKCNGENQAHMSPIETCLRIDVNLGQCLLFKTKLEELSEYIKNP